MIWDVIIAGAGPAGSTAARELAERGLRVLLLEKEHLPRHKTCGGGVTVKTANLLGFDIGEAVEDVSTAIVLSYLNGPRTTRQSERPLVYMTMRRRFDQLLALRAVDAGATLCDETSVRAVVLQKDGVTVHTDSDAHRARVAVGADGFRSVVARKLGLTESRRFALAIAAEVSCSPAVIEAWRGKIYVDYGRCLHGYGWVFPKADHLSVGISGPPRLARELRAGLSELWSNLDLGDHRPAPIRSGFMSFRSERVPVSRGCCLLLGDAAGLADALTGEGIYYAVRSAQLAAPAITDFLAGRAADLSAYDTSVNAELMPEIKLSQKLARVTARMPGVAYNFVTSQTAWNAACRLFRGEAMYSNLHLELSPFKRLLGI